MIRMNSCGAIQTVCVFFSFESLLKKNICFDSAIKKESF